MPRITTFSLLTVLCAAAAGISACGADVRYKQAAPHATRQMNIYTNLHPNTTVRIQRVAHTAREPKAMASQKVSADTGVYGLNVGDTVKVTTFGHPDLSGEFMVESNGSVNLPLVGNIEAVGKSQQQLENDIRYTLASGYLVDPKVSVEVANLRQFYIVGEVGSPGAYDYVPSLNILKAVAIAGGFTRRAVTDEFVILRTHAGAEQKMDAREETVVLPGDTIRVDERFF